ncbi:MAG TPA: hypothetical protein VK601_19130, partial [Kofleriaceae bacterium]|nr:hypothetical protein [Kofleriaceae bacterium]
AGKPDEFPRAADAFQAAIDRDPADQDPKLVFGQFCRAWASALVRAGGDPTAAIDRGLALAKAMIQRRPDWPDARVLQASLTLVKAQHTGDAAERRKLAASAEQDFAGAIKTNPVLAKLWRVQRDLAQQSATR